MTVNSCSFLLFLLIFIETVFSIQNRDRESSNLPICSYPYSCLPTSKCAERHAAQGIDEVLFHCHDKSTVCCPPAKTSFEPASSGHGDSNTYTTTERGCLQCSVTSRPQISVVNEYPVRRENNASTPQGNGQNFGTTQYNISGVGVNHYPQNQPTVANRPVNSQPSDTRRPPPTQPLEGRRPPQSQNSQKPSQTQRPLTLSQSSRNTLSSHRNFRLLPSGSNCGVNTFANRITEGEEVSLGEYPWMVLTGIKDRYGNYRWNCGGTLINGRYVLTAAHCLIVDNRTIEYVRLGEHSLTNDTDCFREVCLEPPEDVRIEEAIPHEKWNTTTIKNDIALLRLSRNPLHSGTGEGPNVQNCNEIFGLSPTYLVNVCVSIFDYIKSKESLAPSLLEILQNIPIYRNRKSNIYPICLPLDPEKLNITSTTKYEVAGWGKTDWNADEGSDVLRKASISGVNREECNICKDKKKQQYCPITDTQLCVQGWKSVDVCKGDSGGPLMVTRLNIYQIGITSFKGSEYCGAENIPSIFTKVESFLPWILDKIRE